MDRTREITKTSIFGIASNVFLAVFKFTVGFTANSVSIVLDAVNNISDALSSVITLVGARLSVKEPDREHPFGYGRVEGLSALLIGTIIMYAGVSALKESIIRIVNPETADYSFEAFIVMAAAIVCKVLIGFYTTRKGVALKSTALKASGKDSIDDSVLTAATLAAALIFIFTGLSLEAYVGAVISLVIIRTGYETLRETVGEILGERVSADLVLAVKNSIMTFPEVEGVYDIVIHSYGKDMLIGSAHIEIADSFKASWIDNLQRSIMKKVYQDTGVTIHGVSVYAVNSKNEKAAEIRRDIQALAEKHEHVMQMHGFYLDDIDKAIKFDIVVSFDAPDSQEIRDAIRDEVKALCPGYSVDITIDHDIS